MQYRMDIVFRWIFLLYIGQPVFWCLWESDDRDHRTFMAVRMYLFIPTWRRDKFLSGTNAEIQITIIFKA